MRPKAAGKTGLQRLVALCRRGCPSTQAALLASPLPRAAAGLLRWRDEGKGRAWAGRRVLRGETTSGRRLRKRGGGHLDTC